MSFPRYSKYKASGVEWLGNVPEGWEVKPLKRNMRLLTEKTDRRDHPVGLENIEGWSGRFILTETAFEGEGIAFDAGDILFGKLRPYLAKAYLAQSSGEAVGDFHVMRPAAGIEARFAQYQILSREFIAIVDGSTFGTKMPRASWEFVGGMKVTLPPLPEQTAIAEFLDRETAKIDELVAEQRRLMELLKEKRQAIISHAVTKGLNPHAPMKPSGIEWLGDVPELWACGSLGYFSLLSTGATPDRGNERYWNGDIPWVKTGEINYSTIMSTEENISQDGFESSAVSIAPSGTLLMALYGQGVTRGRVAILGIPAAFNQACAAIQPDRRVNVFFLHAFFEFAYEFIREIGNETTQMNLNLNFVKKTMILVPPLSEQLQIIEFLRSATNAIDLLMAETQRSIELLKERRSALISVAVTGQIDVRQVAGV